MKKLLAALVLPILLTSPLPARALQTLDGVEGKKHLVRIPARELTRVGIEGGRLKGFKYKLDELEVQQDNDAGAVYLQPLVTEKQISVFVVSGSGATHELVLQPVQNMPLESIVIREPVVRPGRRDAAGGTDSVEKAGALDIAVKRLVLAMAREDATSSEFAIERLQVPLALWTESKFVLVARYTSRSLTGEVFKLMNVSTKPMRVAEQELFKAGVRAVVVEAQILRPGEETDVFIVRVNGND